MRGKGDIREKTWAKKGEEKKIKEKRWIIKNRTEREQKVMEPKKR